MPADGGFQIKDFTSLTNSLLAAVARPLGGRPALTDVTEGSVVRTLVEAFARELAVTYQQLGIVYDYAYLDTAVGPALDNVVGLLGITRQRAGYMTGTVLFQRATPTDADLTVPAGTLVAGPGVPLFATLRDAVMLNGTRLISADVRSVERGEDVPDGQIAAGSLTLMPRPVAGIGTVSNPGALILRQREETDDELRQRARQMVKGANTGTVSAIEQAVRSLGISEVKVLEDLDRMPGVLQVMLGDTGLSADLLEQVRSAVNEVRPAGVRVTVSEATRIVIRVTAILQLSDELPAIRTDAIRASLLQSLTSYFAQLAVGESVRAAKIRNILTSDDSVVGIETAADTLLLDPRNPDGSSAGSRHLLTTGDVVVGRMERAVLGTGDLAPVLTLEPLHQTVWIDVRVDTTLSPSAVSDVPDRTRRLLGNLIAGISKTLETMVGGNGPPVEITYGQLLSCIPDTRIVQKARFTVVHDGPGLVVELERPGDTDGFAPRERPQLRGFDFRTNGAFGG